jgi:hypothetical protein
MQYSTGRTIVQSAWDQAVSWSVVCAAFIAYARQCLLLLGAATSRTRMQRVITAPAHGIDPSGHTRLH